MCSAPCARVAAMLSKPGTDWLRMDLWVCSPAGSYFRLNQHTCHPWLTISEDGLRAVRGERKTPAKEPPPRNTRFSR